MSRYNWYDEVKIKLKAMKMPMSELALRVNISKSTIYGYLSNKKECPIDTRETIVETVNALYNNWYSSNIELTEREVWRYMVNEKMRLKHIYQYQVCNATGLSSSTISNYCTGKVYPSYYYRSLVNDYLGIRNEEISVRVKVAKMSDDEVKDKIIAGVLKDLRPLQTYRRETILKMVKDTLDGMHIYE